MNGVALFQICESIVGDIDWAFRKAAEEFRALFLDPYEILLAVVELG